MARTLLVEVLADASQLERELRKAARSTKQFDRGVKQTARGAIAGSGLFRGLGRSIAFASGAFLGAAGFTAAAKAAFDEMADAQKVTAQTNAVLKSTGGAANVTAQHVDDLGSSLLKLSGVDDEVIKSGENLLLTFTNIRNQVGEGNDIFDQATKAALDMSVALGQDMKSSAIQLGKALNDPIKGITALRRVGVSFTAAQIKQIKTLVQTGRTMEAQKLILRELRREFGDSAKAAGDTLGGNLNKLRENLLNVGGTIATILTPQIEELVKRLNKWLDNPKNQQRIQTDTKKTTHAIGQLVGGFEKVIFVTDKVGDALDEVGRRALHAGFSVQKAVQAVNAVTGETVSQRRPGARAGAFPAVDPTTRRGHASLALQASILNEQLAKAEATAGKADDRAVLVRIANLIKRRIAATKDLKLRTQFRNDLNSVNAQITSIDEDIAAKTADARQKELDARKQAAEKAREHAARIKAALQRQKDALKAAVDAVIGQMGELFDVFVPDDPAKGILGVTGGTLNIKSLTARLKAQTDQQVRFNNDLARLAKRGAPPALVAGLRAQGLAGAGLNVHALATTGTRAEFNRFLAQYNRRQRVAQTIAHAEIQAKTVFITTGAVRHRATKVSQRRGPAAGVVQ